MKPRTTPDSPICSVCIANYNGANGILDCIEAVLAQDCDFDFEIIVHDDASTDNSVDIIRSEFPGIQLLSSDTNVGFCTSNNRMAKVAAGHYLLLLNNDAMLLPDALKTLYRAACGSTPAVFGLPQYDASTGEFVDNGYYCDIFANPMPNMVMDHCHVAFVSGACLWIPLPLWNDSGGFPEWFGSVAEDMYLCARLRLGGHPVIALGKSGFHHHFGFSLGGGRVNRGNRLSSTIRRRSLSERNKTYVMITTYPMCILLLVLPLHLLLLMAEGLLLSVAKSDFGIWKTVYSPITSSILKAKNNLISLRGEIQRRRRINLGDWANGFRFTCHKIQLLIRHGLPELR